MTKIERERVGMIASNFRKNILHKKQTEVAKELNISKQAVSAFEKGNGFSISLFMYFLEMGCSELLWRKKD